MRLAVFGSVIALFLGLSVQHAAAVQLTAELGHTEESTTTLRLGLRKAFQASWWQSDIGHLTGYWDTGYTYWEGDKESNNHSLSFSPVFVYEFSAERVKPYLEAGIGVAAFRHTRVEERNLSTVFQFEDRLGVGLRYRNQVLGLRAVHYSNAGIKRPNDGINLYTLQYSFSL